MSLAPAQSDLYSTSNPSHKLELSDHDQMQNVSVSDLMLDLPFQRLGGSQSEPLLDGLSAIEGTPFKTRYFRGIINETSGDIAGVATSTISETPENAAQSLYQDLLSLLADHSGQLYRVWNFIPQINEKADDLENYRSFNKGRWSAFEDHFGINTLERKLPSASAVGVNGEHLGIAFRAGTKDVTFFENPLQLPAYQYPEEYGPRSPGFARGATVADGTIYLSGTASIRGHKTIGEGNLREQFDTTIANMRVMLSEMGIESIEATSAKNHLRVYLRHADDLASIRSWLSQTLGEEIVEQRTVFLEADICRQQLDLEIEGIFLK